MVASVEPGELLFAALDAGELGETNDLLDRYPEIVDTRDGELRIPLHYAADCADLGTFQRIFNLNRTLIDAQDQFGFTPLLVAVMAGNLDVVEFLIEQNAQLGQLDRDGHSAVHWAVVCGQLDALIKLLRHGAPTAMADIHGAHPLHYATVTAEEEIPAERSEAILHVLLRHGAQLECADLDGRTPLLWAASDGNVRAFQSLIQAGANRFASDRDRLGVLHCAASHGHSQIIQAMLELGHNWIVNGKDRNGDTSLFYASTYGHFECAKLLLENGADPNHQDKRIRTAGHCAAAKGQLRLLKLLRQFGASFGLQNYRGDLPFHEAVQMGSKEIVEWLLGIEPNFVAAPNFYGRSALHLAAASGNMELVVLLCARNAPVNALMLYKGELWTPVDVARKQGHDLIVDYLMGRHEAMSANQISTGKKDLERQSIEEQLKTAKLRKVRAELLANESMEMDGIVEGQMSSSKLRRGKSMLIGQKNGGDTNEEGSREMVDASTMVSRRSSSASGVLNQSKVPKSTSTTDLRGIFEPKRKMIRTNFANENDGMMEEENNVEMDGGMERQIQRIVQEEMQKAAAATNEEELSRRAAGGESSKFDGEEKAAAQKQRSASELEELLEPEATGSSTPPQLAAISPEAESTTGESSTTNLDEGNGNSGVDAGGGKRGGQKGVNGNHKKVHLALKNGEGEKKMIRRRQWTPGHLQTGAEGKEEIEEEDYPLDEAVTELHILEEGLSPPPPGRMATFGGGDSSASTTTRYVHERAIFDELTHLKRMQIQYGKVREEVLVRSLVQNFCRMHAIHPSHFRRIATFYQWEKFLYDQLKQIYLEERERLSAAAAAAAQKAANAVGMRPGAIYSAQQRIFATSSAASFGHQIGGTSSASLLSHHSAADGGGGPSRRFESRKLPRTNPLDQRLQELSRIYNGSDSRSSATSLAIAATNSIAAQASANAEFRRRRQQNQKMHSSMKREKTNAAESKRKEGEKGGRVENQKHYKRCECLEQN